MTDYYKDGDIPQEEKTLGKYQREIKGVVIDVYDILVAFNVQCPAMQHAVKKCIMPGQRGHKSTRIDKLEAINSIYRSLELQSEDK